MSREVRLARYPSGRVSPDDFALADAAPGEPGAGEALVEVAWLSMDPIVRMRLKPPLPLGDTVPGRGVGRVIASHDPAVPVGAAVYGELGWREHAVLPRDALTVLTGAGAPLRHHLNALGPPGLAAYFAVGRVALLPGETVVIAPAAGAVGGLAAQIARHRGARVVGVGTGAAQLAHLRGQGFDAIDAAADPAAALPDGVDAFIDGVGGALHDRIVQHLNPQARVLLLGFVAGYGDAARPRYGDMAQLLMKRARAEGFLLADHMDRAAEARAQLAAWLADGTLEPAETIWDGLARAPDAFAALFGDAPPGKQLVRVSGGDEL